MKVSIALATYNGADFLSAQLDSYLIQNVLPDQLVVCDDASTDDTWDILASFRKSAPFEVQLFKNDVNRGYTESFEKALSLCFGDIIFFSDQDDVWFSEKVSTVVQFFRHNRSCSLMVHDGELVAENLLSTGITKQGQLRDGGYGANSIVTGALTAISKDMVDLLLPFPEGIAGGHDGWIHNVARLLERRAVIGQVLQKLRRHQSNTSDWVASSVKRINRVGVLASQLLTAPASSYADRLLYNESLHQILDEIESGSLSVHYVVDYGKVGGELKVEREALLRREMLVSRGFFGRKLCAISMLLNGGYSHFNGVRSFLRDMIR